MSVLSFCINCVNHNDIPLEAIAKFFYGQRVGYVCWIDVVEYIEVDVCGAHSQENFETLRSFWKSTWTIGYIYTRTYVR